MQPYPPDSPLMYVLQLIRDGVRNRFSLQALSFSKEVFGDGSIEMVPPYLLLSEANLGLGLLQSAEGFLSMANWSILKTPKCSNAIRSQVRPDNVPGSSDVEAELLAIRATNHIAGEAAESMMSGSISLRRRQFPVFMVSK